MSPVTSTSPKLSRSIKIAGRDVGPGHPVFIVAEIGVNHQGDVETAKRLIEMAAAADCDAVKFQKRTPVLAVPSTQWDVPKETPWGVMPYLEYRQRMEFELDEWDEIDAFCKALGVTWFASAWDRGAVEDLERFDLPCHKVASACLTDDDLLTAMAATGKPVILSTGMSTFEQIDHAVSLLPIDRLLITHCTSTYPCPPEELNLSLILALQEAYGVPVGYSGHEAGLQTTYAAVTLGACLVERHVTLDRAMWGSDQAASLEPDGLRRLVRDIRVIERAMGDGVKRVYDSERPAMEKLRLHP
jgi:N-acetylneuraminate synthase